jgi:hypothetical protein
MSNYNFKVGRSECDDDKSESRLNDENVLAD